MRTTLTLDPDVAERLRQEVIPGKTSLKQVINDCLRVGLGIAPSGQRKSFRVVPHHSPYQPGIDPARLNQLYDELEVEAHLENRNRSRS